MKFIFLSLSKYLGKADDNINAFLRSQPKTRFEVIDINRIKIDFIDQKYKDIIPINPLENYLNPDESEIEIEIEQLGKTDGNIIKIDRPFEAYVMLIRPKIIYDLFDKYGFTLFHKNVRNPLMQSLFNSDIVNTASDNPSYFWYYNNGLTAITSLLPSVRNQAVSIKLIGFQVINGAQTVYSVYSAYKAASPTKRIQMDSETLLTLRLLKSGGKDFDLNVTKYTNSQNPVISSDFYANDDIQVRLQNESYDYKVWYQKRRGEFRTLPDNVKAIPNYVFANAYLAYHLQNPVAVINNKTTRESSKELNFISHRDHKDGFYEKIFNEETSFEDMLCAFYLLDFINLKSRTSYAAAFSSNIFHTLALLKSALKIYLTKKHKSEDINISRFVIKIFKDGNTDLIIKLLKYLTDFMNRAIPPGENQGEKIIKYFSTLSHYEQIRDLLEEQEIIPDEIDNLPINKELSGPESRATKDEFVYKHVIDL